MEVKNFAKVCEIVKAHTGRNAAQGTAAQGTAKARNWNANFAALAKEVAAAMGIDLDDRAAGEARIGLNANPRYGKHHTAQSAWAQAEGFSAQDAQRIALYIASHAAGKPDSSLLAAGDATAQLAKDAADSKALAQTEKARADDLAAKLAALQAQVNAQQQPAANGKGK